MDKAELAWPEGDRPTAAAGFDHPVPDDLADRLRSLLPAPFDGATEIAALAPATDLFGRYRMVLDGAPLFLRITRRLGDPGLEQALLSHAAGRGVAVSPYLHAALTEVDGVRLRVDLRPLASGRHPHDSDADAASLASELRRLHDALADFPRRQDVRATARRRFARLQAFSDDMAVGRLPPLPPALQAWFGARGDWLRACAASLRPLALVEAADAQCLHAEPTPANLLIDGAQARLIDFEEAVHVYASPLWDLAFLVQRLRLSDDPTAEVARARLQVVEDAYGRPLAGVFDVMRGIAWATLMMILDHAAAGVETPVGECDKFQRLERQAARLAAAEA